MFAFCLGGPNAYTGKCHGGGGQMGLELRGEALNGNVN
jgi:hypothetical protein